MGKRKAGPSKDGQSPQGRRVLQLKVTLQGVRPPIWRRLAVPADITLGRLHHVLQIAMGWTDSHLHQFTLRDKSLRQSPHDIVRLIEAGRFDEVFTATHGMRAFVPRGPEFDDLEIEGEDEDGVALAQVCRKAKSTLLYEYDFGDGWEHKIVLEKTFDAEGGVQYRVCLKGKRACPPEDCGGAWGYSALLHALADPDHPDHEDMVEWAGEIDPEEFDLEEVNECLKRLQ